MYNFDSTFSTGKINMTRKNDRKNRNKERKKERKQEQKKERKNERKNDISMIRKNHVELGLNFFERKK